MSGLNIKSGCCCWCVFLGSALCSCFTAHGAAPIASFGGREGCVTNVCSCSHSCFASVSIPTQAPMWCCWRASPQTAPPSISTVTTWLWRGGARLPLKIRWNIPKVRAFSLCHYRPRSSWSPVDPVHHPTLCISFFFFFFLSWKQQPNLCSNPRRGTQIPGRLRVLFGEGYREWCQADSIWGGPDSLWRNLQQQGCTQTQVPGRPEAEAGKHWWRDCERWQRWRGGGWGGKTSLTTAGPERFTQLKGFYFNVTGTPYLKVLGNRNLIHFHSSMCNVFLFCG